MLQGQAAAHKASLVSGPFRAAPTAYLTPDDEESLGNLLRWAWENSVPLVPRAAGTGMPGGNLGSGIVVEIGRAFAEIEADPCGSGSLRVGAGVSGREADRAARELGGFLPFLPSSSPWCSVGGMVATNAAGARSFRYGATHAWVETVEGFLAWGEPFRVGADQPSPDPFDRLHASLLRSIPMREPGGLRGWPQVRKNSSGYALDRFLPSGNPAQLVVGSEGTLAVVTKVGLRTAPLPEDRGLAVLRCTSAEDLEDKARLAAEVGATACEFLGRRCLELVQPDLDPELRDLSGKAFALAILEVTGPAIRVSEKLGALERQGGRSRSSALFTRDAEEAARLWALRHAASPLIAEGAGAGRFSTQFIEDSVVPPDRLARYLVELDRILEDVRLDAVTFGHAGDANVHVNPLVPAREADWRVRVREALEAVTELVAALGGTLSGEHGDGRLRAPMLPRIWSAGWMRAFREVKKTLDPRGILNPGVILGLEGQDPLDGLTPRARAHPS